MSDKKIQIQQLLTRGVEHIYPKPEFLEARLNEDKQISIYLGIDPTGPNLHIGHMIPLRKLKQFQDLGHKIILLIGDFTAMIGDPTDKSATRKQLTREEVLENCKKYKEQASKILDFDGDNAAQMVFNGDWLSKLTFAEVVELSAHFTVQQMLERDMFQERMAWKLRCKNCGSTQKRNKNSLTVLSPVTEGDSAIGFNCANCKTSNTQKPKPIGLHEFLYPLMQGYDSVAMEIDGEVGGNDQTFNMLAGRTLEKQILNKEKFVITMKLLADTTGKKMGKTEGNMITLEDSPQDMFGKVMSWTDGMIIGGFELCTDVSDEEIAEISEQLNGDAVNPRDLKMRLAREIVMLYHSQEQANAAQEHFINLFSNKNTPDEIPEFKAEDLNIVSVLVDSGLCSSKSDARRNIEQGGVKVNDEKVTDDSMSVAAGDVIQKGKRHFVKVG